MPYKVLTRPSSVPPPELVRVIADELRGGAADFETESSLPTSPAEAPVIIEEPTPRGPIHVTVVWNAWADLQPEDRGRVILEAYRQAQGEDKTRHISVALGVTSSEARRLGLVPAL